MNKSALNVALSMPLPDYAMEQLAFYSHPQERTLAFHRFYDAPIRDEQPDKQFSHMSDERVAFRAAFILSEALELLAKGLGVKVVNLGMRCSDGQTVSCLNRDDADLTGAIHAALRHSPGKRDLVEVVDALGDLNVVVNGFAIELGVDMQKVDQEVCASNFTKADENGNPIIGDGKNGPVGKVLKGPNYLEPQLAAILGLGD